MPQNVLARSAFALTCLLVVGIAWSLADTAWFMATGGQPAAKRPPARSAAHAASAPAADLQKVADQHLFGVAQAVAPAAPGADAPVTALPLQLLGVFVARRPDESTAVIAEQNRDGELFRVGDHVPGNAMLAEVHNDRVVLKRGSDVETLRFPEFAGGGGFANADEPGPTFGSDFVPPDPGPVDAPAQDEDGAPLVVDPPPQASNGSGRGNGSLATYRDRMKADPHAVLNEVGMQPISGAAAQGYRIGDNLGAGLARVGLQPGDVLLTVNGRPVGNVSNDQQQIDSVMSQGSARLEIQRGNRRFFVTASLR